MSANTDPFKKAEEDYFILRGQLAIGRITREQFVSAVNQLRVQDAQARYWTLNADSGRWLVYDGRQWIEAATPTGSVAMPPPPPSSPPAVAAKQGGGCGCGRMFACGCVALVLLCVAFSAGGYWAYSSGALTLTTALNIIGQGPADIEVDNFRDDKIEVGITQLDVTKDSIPTQGALKLNVFDITSFRVPQPGKYRVDFATADKRTTLGTCALTLRSGDVYQFVALPDQIIVNRANNPSSVGADLPIATSALCR